MTDDSRRIVVGISGASGVAYGLEMLRVLRDLGYESHAVVSKGARKVFELETDVAIEEVEAAAAFVHHEDDLGAPISSGSFITGGMVVIPCSIKTLSGVAHSYNANLLARAADVTHKDRRTLVLVVRETPLHRGHLELMHSAAALGAVFAEDWEALREAHRRLADRMRPGVYDFGFLLR